MISVGIGKAEQRQLADEALGSCHWFGITIVFVTHDVDESVYLADRLVVLSPAPVRVVGVVPIDLPKPRDQVATKGCEPADLRAQMFRLIKRRSDENGGEIDDRPSLDIALARQ